MLAEPKTRSVHRIARAALALVLGLLALTLPVTAASAAPGPVQLAIAVPITVPQNTSGLIGASDLTDFTSPTGTLTRQLDAIANRTVAIAVDPMIIASIRVLGNTAPASATEWLDKLRNVSNDVFALGYADTDLTLATQAGLVPVPQPQNFDFLIDAERFAPVTTATPTPAASGDPGDPGFPLYPTTEMLLDWPYTLENVAWPRARSVIETDVAALAQSGYERLILDGANVTLPAGSGPVVTIGETPSLVSDVAVSTALRTATRSVGDPLAAITGLTSAIAAAGAAQTGERATVFATLPREQPTASYQFGAVLNALLADPNVELVRLSSILDSPAGTGTIVAEPQDAERLSTVSRMPLALAEEARAAIIADDPETLIAQRELQQVALLSASWTSATTAWNTAIDAFFTRSNTIVHGVEVIGSSAVNLVADNGFLPVAVSNALDQGVTVYVSVRPVTPLIAVGEQFVELHVPAASQASASIPVQSLSNGEVDLEITLTAADGSPVGSMSVVEVTVNAGWETPVIVVLASAVVLIFGFGIVRNILRRRKGNRDESESDAAADVAAGGADD